MRTTILAAAAVFCCAMSFGQLKSQIDQQSVSNSLLRPMGSANLFGWFDPNRFSMKQNFSFGYVSGGGQGVSLASYTNSMRYQLSDPLQARFDVTLIGSPFGGSNAYGANSFNKLFISRAELNYKFSENSFLSVQYRQLPYTQWMMLNPFGGYRSSFLTAGDGDE